MAPLLLRSIGTSQRAAGVPSGAWLLHGVSAMLVSRETARQIIPAAFTRRMHECHTPIQAGRRELHRGRVCRSISPAGA